MPQLRIDVYLKLIGIFKTRSAAGRAASAGYVSSGERILKPSHAVVAGDILHITRPDGSRLSIRITDVPVSGQVSRRDRAKYFAVLEGPG
jgi:ribosomal 50S subunit-recycling heat shock protein